MSGAGLLKRIRKEHEQQIEELIRAGQNEKELRLSGRRLTVTMEAYEKLLESRETGEDRSAAGSFPVLQEAFAQETAAREKVMEEAMEKLEYAFDFMEAAFGESQEMVMFITELSVNPYAAAFLRENDCARYYMYNKNLLFEDRDARIREQLDQIRDLQIT